MNRCRPIVAQLTRCSQGYSRHESPTSHVCTREESEQLAPSSITTTSATTGFFSASSTSSLFGCPRTWLQTLRTGTVAAGSRVCVGTEIYLRLREWDCDRQEAFSFLSGSAWTYVPRAWQWHRFRSIRGTWQPPCTCGVSPRVHLARTKLRLGNAFVRHRWASRTSLLLSYSLNSLYSFSLLARLDFHSTTPFFFPTPFSSHPTLHAFTYRWIFSPSSPPFEFERSNRPHQVEWSRDGYTREKSSRTAHGRVRLSVSQLIRPSSPITELFRAAVRSPPILRARLTVSTVTLRPRLTSFCDPHGIDDGYHEPTDVADRFPQMSSSVPVSVVTGLSDAPSPATNAGLILIWLQRRAVSPPRLSLALALCAAYRHRCLSSRFNRGRSSCSRLPSLSGRRRLSLSLSLHPFPFPLVVVLAHPPLPPPLFERPTSAHRGVAWYTIRYNPLPPFSRREFRPSSSRCYSACQHRRRRENRYYGEINMIGRRMPRYPYTWTLRTARLARSAACRELLVPLFARLSPSSSFALPSNWRSSRTLRRPLSLCTTMRDEERLSVLDHR